MVALRFARGERKKLSNIKISQNIMTMIVAQTSCCNQWMN